MEVKELVKKILSAKSIKELVDINDYATSWKNIMKQIHPDVYKESDASTVSARFMQLKDLWENGWVFDDDSGTVRIKEDIITFEGTADLIKKSQQNYERIYRMANDNFKRYLPNKFIGNTVTLDDNFLSLKDVDLPEEHARWVLSRLLEFSGYMESVGYVHAGLTLDSFLVNPKTHGIKVISFYHMKPINSKLETVSAKFYRLYPSAVFDKKLAEPKIDLELAKRTICFILGDKSGMGVKLKKTVSAPFIEFLLKTNSNSIEAFIEWRKLLKDNYESKFYPLEL
jgi:hypothetical protein